GQFVRIAVLHQKPGPCCVRPDPSTNQQFPPQHSCLLTRPQRFPEAGKLVNPSGCNGPEIFFISEGNNVRSSRLTSKIPSLVLDSAAAQAAFAMDLLLKIWVIRAMLGTLGLDMLGVWGAAKTVSAFPIFLVDAFSSAVFLEISRKRNIWLTRTLLISAGIS